MKSPSLKSSLVLWNGFPRVGSKFAPILVQKAATAVAKELGAIQPRMPSSYDLEELHQRIKESWHRNCSLERIEARDLRRLPWVLFYPAKLEGRSRQEGPIRWLGAEHRIVKEYGRWLSGGHQARSILYLLHEFLRVYPVGLQTFDDLRILLRNAIERSSATRASLRRWHQRCHKFGLLAGDGGISFSEKLISGTESLEEILRKAGLDAGLSHSGFLKSSIRRYLPKAGIMLKHDRFDATLLIRLLALLESDGTLRFEERTVRKDIAEALLRPFADRPAEPRTRDLLQPFFLRHFGDPRLPSSKAQWSEIPDDTRHVVIRWLIERVLEQFFILLKETALDHHWRYREAFWRAFLGKDLIDDIWFVLGPRASAMLRKIKGKESEANATATLRGAGGNQSVLLLRMPGVTIAEWSHNGSCRFWLDGALHAPMLYKSEYSRSDLTHGADFTQPHHGSQEGRWQDSIAGWLRDHRGIEIQRTDYLPRSVRQARRRFPASYTY